MIKAFLINLDRDKERLVHMDAQLQRVGITYERFPAIYGKDIDAYAFIDADKSLQVEGRRLSPGDIGTALSHRTVYEKIIESNCDYALIMEDDVILPENFRDVVEREVAKNKDSKKWDYLAFDYGPMDFSLYLIWINSYKVLLSRVDTLGKVKVLVYGLFKAPYIAMMFLFEIFRNLLLKSNPRAVKFYRPMYNAGAYIITREGAETLKGLATPIYCTSDRLHNQARVKVGLSVYWYAPAVVRQVREQFGSTASEQSALQYKEGKAYVK